MRALKLIVVVIVTMVAIGAGVGYRWLSSPPRTYSSGTLVIIQPHSTAADVARTLAGLNIISHPSRFVRLARILGFDKRIQPGRYLLPERRNELEVLKIISSLRFSRRRVTIPEGLTVKDIGPILERNGVCTAAQFAAEANDLQIPRLPFRRAEGFLFPDTYDLPVGLGARATIELMVGRFFDVYDDLIRANPLTASDLLETVTLASMVEKEAKLGRERPIIASVFRNRLKKKMLLESCSTVEYALPSHKPALSYSDLKISSPYNTYIHPGLPPGPICNPGRASLSAALKPAPTDYLYFVSNGDGSHTFTKTFGEHIQAKNRAERIRNDDN